MTKEKYEITENTNGENIDKDISGNGSGFYRFIIVSIFAIAYFYTIAFNPPAIIQFGLRNTEIENRLNESVVLGVMKDNDVNLVSSGFVGYTDQINVEANDRKYTCFEKAYRYQVELVDSKLQYRGKDFIKDGLGFDTLLNSIFNNLGCIEKTIEKEKQKAINMTTWTVKD